MENLNNIETYLKVLVGVIGAIIAFSRLRENFASIKRKQEVKLELEILEKMKSNNIDSSKIENALLHKLEQAFEDRTDNLTNFFTGIAVFIGFGFWTVDLFLNSDGFNFLIIFTLFLSLIGLTIVIGNNEKKAKGELFYQIGFYDKTNFQAGLIISLLFGILTPILIVKLDGFSFWQFCSGLFFFIGITSLIKNSKRIKNNG